MSVLRDSARGEDESPDPDPAPIRLTDAGYTRSHASKSHADADRRDCWPGSCTIGTLLQPGWVLAPQKPLPLSVGRVSKRPRRRSHPEIEPQSPRAVLGP